ncbi:MAG: hypothetical protein ACK4N5_11840 [Myxococcales bacterium]
MSLLDRFDPPPARHVYRWDLDKTYLKTEFDTFGDLLRTAFQKAEEKVNVPGTAALMRELRQNGVTPNRVCIISGSPRQMRAVLEEKLRLDGNTWDELVLKPNISNMLRGRFRAVRGQLGYKLPALLESRARTPLEAEETLFGDDAEADAFIYSLYSDLVAGRVDGPTLEKILEAGELYDDQAETCLQLAAQIEKSEITRRIFIHLDRRSPPARFSRYGPRVVPIYNYFQAALVLMTDGQLGSISVLKVAAEMVANYGYSVLTLGNSFQDLVRRGLPVAGLAVKLAEAITSDNPLTQVLRPAPDIFAAFAKRIAALGAVPAPPPPVQVDYLALLDDARPRKHGRPKQAAR